MKAKLTDKIITSEEMVNEELQHFKEKYGFDLNKISDGYHTFGELYDHRITLYIKLCEYVLLRFNMTPVWRSKLHHDGTSFDGWFIMGIFKEPGEQISYHLPMSRWDDTNFQFMETLDKAPEWDGHTPAEALERLAKI